MKLRGAEDRLSEVRTRVEFDRLLTKEEVGFILKVSGRYVFQLWEFGRLKGVKVGKYLRFHPEDVKKFIEENREKE